MSKSLTNEEVQYINRTSCIKPNDFDEDVYECIYTMPDGHTFKPALMDKAQSELVGEILNSVKTLGKLTFQSGTMYEILVNSSEDSLLDKTQLKNLPIERQILKAKMLERFRYLDAKEGIGLIKKTDEEWIVTAPCGFIWTKTSGIISTIRECWAKRIEFKGEVPVYFNENPFAYAYDNQIHIESPYYIGRLVHPAKELLGLTSRFQGKESNQKSRTSRLITPGRIVSDYNFGDKPAIGNPYSIRGSMAETITGDTFLFRPMLFRDKINELEILQEINVKNLIMILDGSIKIPKGCTAKKFKKICMDTCFENCPILNKKNIQLKVLKSFPYDDLNLFYYGQDTDDWCIPIEKLSTKQIEEARILLRLDHIRTISRSGAKLQGLGITFYEKGEKIRKSIIKNDNCVEWPYYNIKIKAGNYKSSSNDNYLGYYFHARIKGMGKPKRIDKQPA